MLSQTVSQFTTFFFSFSTVGNACKPKVSFSTKPFYILASSKKDVSLKPKITSNTIIKHVDWKWNNKPVKSNNKIMVKNDLKTKSTQLIFKKPIKKDQSGYYIVVVWNVNGRTEEGIHVIVTGKILFYFTLQANLNGFT